MSLLGLVPHLVDNGTNLLQTRGSLEFALTSMRMSIQRGWTAVRRISKNENDVQSRLLLKSLVSVSFSHRNLLYFNYLLQSVTNNPHVAEERGIVVDDSGVNEEDK